MNMVVEEEKQETKGKNIYIINSGRGGGGRDEVR